MAIVSKTKHNIFILKTEWICTDDISCSNHGTCGTITHGVCDCKGGYGSTENCSGESLHLLNDKNDLVIQCYPFFGARKTMLNYLQLCKCYPSLEMANFIDGF